MSIRKVMPWRLLARCLLYGLIWLAAAAGRAGPLQTAHLGTCELENGQALENCRLVYRTYGELNREKSNAVLMPTWYNGSAQDLEKYGYLGPGKIVDTDRYFVIAVNALGNGISSSPSNYSASGPFPEFSIRDLVHTQHRLLTEELGLEKVHAVVGASLGGHQVYEWLMQYPRFANHFVPIESAPWPTHYDLLLRTTWREALSGNIEDPEEARRTVALLTTIDALTLWTPDYVNREGGQLPFARYLESIQRRKDRAYLIDRASQTNALFTHDIRAPYPDFKKHLESLGDPSVLAVVFRSDLMVNPGPNRDLAAMMDFEVMEIAGDCGHMGPNPECYQAQVAEKVQQFLAGAPDSRPEMHRYVMTHDGIQREYFVYRPPTAPVDQPLPVVLALHGYGVTATGFQAIYALNRHARAHNYMVVYPQGSHFMGAFGEDPTTEEFFMSSWNDQVSNFTPGPGGRPQCTDDRLKYPCPPECGSCNHCAWVSCYDDFGFLNRVLDSVQSQHSTDVDRLYLLGNSNGGTMAMRLGCDMPARFAAMAVLLIQMPPGYDCAPQRSLPLLHLYGEKDDVIGHDGTPTSQGWIYTSAEVTAQTWARGMDCEAEPSPWHSEIGDANGLQCQAFTQCRVPGHQLVSCMDPEGGHEWRGQRLTDIPQDCASAEQRGSLPDQPHCQASRLDKQQWGMDLVWQFLSQYRRADRR